jgi:tetratricopeptide (TPR) repeat protein
VLAAAPPSFEASMREGMAALQRNDLPAAQYSLEQAVKMEPASAAGWFLLAQTYAKRDNMKSALPAAQRASRNAGKDASILYNLSLFYRDAELPDESIAHAKRALALEDSADVRTLLGKAFAQKKDWPDAVAQFREALRLTPYSEEPIFNLAQACLQAQDFAAAVEVLEAGRKTFDKSPQLELALGVAYYGQRNFAGAVDRYLRVMDLAPDVPQPYYFVARILEHALHRIPKVIEHAVYFEKQHPQSPLGFVLHAKALILQLPPAGFPPEAQQAYGLLEKAASLENIQAEVPYLLGTLLDRKQDYAAAALMLERSIQLDPRGAAAHFRLARVYERLGRKEEAAAQRAIHERLSAGEGGLKTK